MQIPGRADYKVLDDADNTIALTTPLPHNAGGQAMTTGGLIMQAEQSADFMAVAGNEYPVNTAASNIVVSEPASPITSDSFAVFCSRLTTDATNTIRVEFNSERLHSLAAPDYAEIQVRGGRLEFTYVDANIGWRIAADGNL